MKRLLLAAALAPLSFAAAAHAQTTISTATTTPLTTSASGDITITSAGSVTPATSASSGTVAITINSNNSVDNEGVISVTETTTGDTTNATNGIITGPFANGSGRFGILVAPGGPFTGDITSGSAASITVVGENSAGISLKSGLNGFINNSGAITVTGGNNATLDVSYGIFSDTNAPISGNVTVAGAITATGNHITGVALNGGVGGSIDIDAAISATGYHSTTAPTTPAALASLTSDQLDQGGPALSIGGNVAGGLTVDAPVAASGNISATAGGTLSVFGSAPALLVGGAGPVTIGAGADGYAMTIGGSVSGAGTYPGFNATGIQIGGVNNLAVVSGGEAAGGNFSTVDLAGGLDISGTVTASAIANATGVGGAATGIEIGQGATVPRITISGQVVADGGNAQPVAGPAAGNVTAIRIDQGAAPGATTLTNSGAIIAEVTGIAGVAGLTEAAGGVLGNATAISDAGGGLSQITNTGNISATITPAVAGQPTAPQSQTTAIFEDNTLPVTVMQCTAVNSGGNCATTGNATFQPNITGDVNFASGTGAVTLDLWGGNLTGATMFGNSTGNVFDIENGGRAKGALSVAAGGQIAVNVNSGQLFMTTPGLVALSTLHVGQTGSVIFTADPLGNATSSGFAVAGGATLDSGAEVGLALTAPLTTTETFTVITAANLTAGNISSTLLGQIPFLENGVITTTPTSLSITASPKSAGALGFNPAEAAMFPAFTAAFGSDADVAADILSKTDRASFIHAYDQFLPDYSGGPFETLATGQQSIARAEADAPVKLQTDAVRGWVQEIGINTNEATTTRVNGFEGLGFGVAGGLERASGDSAIGIAAAFVTTGVQDETQPADQALSASAFELGAYWRKGGGRNGLVANASVNGGFLTLGSHRFLIDQANSNDLQGTPSEIVSREAKASWLGGIVSVNAGLGYQFGTPRFFMRPEVSADYVLMTLAAYKERGGGPAFDLDVASQTASQADAQADVVIGMNFGQTIVWRPELTVGYRAVITGGPAATTANFVGGKAFTLNPQFTDKGGLLARLGVRATGQYADFSADAGGEYRTGYTTYDARAAARFLF